ncbi:MAG: SGNH/GDSL hydrolase family protein [Cellvibrionaceae bacterium]
MKVFLFTLVLFVYGLFFAEWFLRALNPQAILPRYIQEGPYGVRANIPNAEYRHSTPEVEVSMRINSQGMRASRDYEVSKPAGVCRVAIFGDSFFMGYEAKMEHSYAGQLESHLKSFGKNCQVLNFSVSGFGTAESLIILKEKALAYSPDYIVLEWHYTDPNDNLRSNLFAVDENNRLIRAREKFLPGVAIRKKLMQFSLYRWAIEYSHLYTVGREKLASSIKNTLVKVRNFELFPEKKPEPANVEAISEAIVVNRYSLLDQLLVNEFDAIAKNHGAKFVVLDVPQKNFNGEIVSSFKYLDESKIMADRVLSPVDLFKDLTESNVELYRTRGHKHFNEKGYSELALLTAQGINQLSKNDN